MDILKTQMIATESVAENRGQVPGLPANPRQWTRDEVERLARSLRETPELFAARPIIAVEHGGQYVALGGNMRLAASRQNGDTEVPAIVFPASTPPETLRQIVIKDNGSFGRWDYDMLANEWGDLPLPEWGIEVAAEAADTFVEKIKHHKMVPYRHAHILLTYDMAMHTDIMQRIEQSIQGLDVEILQTLN